VESTEIISRLVISPYMKEPEPWSFDEFTYRLSHFLKSSLTKIKMERFINLCASRENMNILYDKEN